MPWGGAGSFPGGQPPSLSPLSTSFLTQCAACAVRIIGAGVLLTVCVCALCERGLWCTCVRVRAVLCVHGARARQGLEAMLSEAAARPAGSSERTEVSAGQSFCL